MYQSQEEADEADEEYLRPALEELPRSIATWLKRRGGLTATQDAIGLVMAQSVHLKKSDWKSHFNKVMDLQPPLKGKPPSLAESRELVQDLLQFFKQHEQGVDGAINVISKLQLGKTTEASFISLLEDYIGINEHALLEVLADPIVSYLDSNLSLNVTLGDEQSELVVRELIGRQRRLALRWWMHAHKEKESEKQLPVQPYNNEYVSLWSQIIVDIFREMNCVRQKSTDQKHKDRMVCLLNFGSQDVDFWKSTELQTNVLTGAVLKIGHFNGLFGLLYLRDVQNGTYLDCETGRKDTWQDVHRKFGINVLRIAGEKELCIRCEGNVDMLSDMFLHMAKLLNSIELDTGVFIKKLDGFYKKDKKKRNKKNGTNGKKKNKARKSKNTAGDYGKIKDGTGALVSACEHFVRFLHELEMKGSMDGQTMFRGFEVIEEFHFDLNVMNLLMPCLMQCVVDMFTYNVTTRMDRLKESERYNDRGFPEDKSIEKNTNGGPYGLLALQMDILKRLLFVAIELNNNATKEYLEKFTDNIFPLYFTMMKNQNDPKLGMLASRAFRKIYSSSLCPEKLHKILWKNWTVIEESIVTPFDDEYGLREEFQFAWKCKQISTLCILYAVADKSCKSVADNLTHKEINKSCKKLMKLGTVELLLKLVNDNNQPREINILAIEILDHFTRLRECRMEMFRMKNEILLCLQTTTVPEIASSMFLTLAHLFWDIEWYTLFEQDLIGVWQTALEKFVIKWSCLAIDAITSHELAQKRMWRLELHACIQSSAQGKNEDHIPAFYSFLLKRIFLMVINYQGTSMKLGTEQESAKKWKKCGMWSLMACLYTSESIDLRKTTSMGLMYHGNVSIEDVNETIAPLFAGWLLYEGANLKTMEYFYAKVDRNAKDMFDRNMAQAEMRVMLQRMEVLNMFAAIPEWRTLLDAHYINSPLIPLEQNHNLAMHLEECERGPLKAGIMGERSLFANRTLPSNVAGGQSTMHKMCDNKKCQKIEKKVKEFSRCGRCKKTRYCSPECQKRHWKQGHKLECKAQEKKKGTKGK